jgi:hypothetical protein
MITSAIPPKIIAVLVNAPGDSIGGFVGSGVAVAWGAVVAVGSSRPSAEQSKE